MMPQSSMSSNINTVPDDISEELNSVTSMETESEPRVGEEPIDDSPPLTSSLSSIATPGSFASEPSEFLNQGQSTGNTSDIAVPSQEGTKAAIAHSNLNQPIDVPFKVQVISCAVALSMLPVLAVGTATYLGGQAVQKQVVQGSQSTQQKLDATKLSIQQQLPTLLIGTGLTAVLAGVISAWLAYRATTPLLKAATVSSEMLQKIRPGRVKREQNITALTELERNIRDIEDYLPALLEQQDAEIEQLQMLRYITTKIRTSLNEEDVLKTTVEEARKLLKTDRVIVYTFDENWSGTVVAESVLPGLPKALWTEIRDPCFAETYVEKYRNGRTQAINNIFKAGLTDCHLDQLESFQVKANLVVPILRHEHLFGLLIAHQCTQPRVWQETEIHFFEQVASQVGFALDHAQLMVQVDKMSNVVVAHSEEAAQTYQTLQQQVAYLSTESQSVTELLSADASMAVTQTQDHIKEIEATADHIHHAVNSINEMQQQAQIMAQESLLLMGEAVHHVNTLNQVVTTIDQTVHPLHQPTQQLGELVDLMGHVISQVQLQAMNAALEAARSGAAGQSFAQIAEKVHGLSRQLDATLTDIKPLVTHIQETTQTAVTNMVDVKTTLIADTQSLGHTQEKLEDLNNTHQDLFTLVQQIAEATTTQIDRSSSSHETLDELSNTMLSATEHSVQLAEVIQQLKITTSYTHHPGDQSTP